MQMGDLEGAVASPSIEQLRELVSTVLCERNDFEKGIFRLSERMLKKGQQMCGIFFCLHGPRSVKLTAVWECKDNSVRFYGAGGEKFKTINLECEHESIVVNA